MKQYTLGAFFRSEYSEVLLIDKNTPAWQAGKKNLPGGKIDFSETALESISREFIEETGYVVPQSEWVYAGRIIAGKAYTVDIFAAYYNSNMFVQPDYKEGTVSWNFVSSLFVLNVLPNLRWMIPFCADLHRRRTDNGEQLSEGVFNYKLV